MDLVGSDAALLTVKRAKFISQIESLVHAPNYTRCVAWSYADHSIRLVPHDSDRALMVCEKPFHQEIVTCVFLPIPLPMPTYLIESAPFRATVSFPPTGTRSEPVVN